MNSYFSRQTTAIVLLALTILLLLMPITSYATSSPATLDIKLSLKQQQGEYHPPYVAAWIENQQKKSLRTLVLWRKEAKWLKDIRRWWRNVGRKDPALVDAITSATHAAGTFPLSFLALDDKKQPLAQGDYTLYIEVVREKGGRALIKQAFKINNEKQQFTLKATAETNAITLTINPTESL